MDNGKMEKQLEDIQSKLDLITEEMEMMRRHRRAMDELRDDLTVVAQDMFNTAVVELDEIAPFVDTADFFHLWKKLLRNTARITDVITKFEATMDLFETAGPIIDDVYNVSLNKLDEMERKGYFVFFNSMTKMLDRVVDKMCPEDCQIVGDRVLDPSLDMVKSIANSNFMTALSKSIEKVKEKDEKEFEYSLLKIMREFNSPETRKALGIFLFFLQNLVEESYKSNQEQGDKNGS